MKKIFIVLALQFCICIGMNAQAKIVFNGPLGLDIKYKRCYVREDQCHIDFQIINNMSKSIEVNHENQAVYDDEGNVYNYLKADVTIGGSARYISVPAEASIKGHVTVSEFDEFAATITTLKMDILTYDKGKTGRFPLEIKNIPVSRE